MRNLNQMLKAFVTIGATTALLGCEEIDPPKPVAPPVVRAAVNENVKPDASEDANVDASVNASVNVDANEPDSVDGILSATRKALADHELDRADRLARLAVRKAPKRSAAWNLLGRSQLSRGQRKEAIVSFEKSVELNPKSSFAYNNLGLALLYDGRYDDAVDALEEATSLDPVEPYMFNNLGMAYEHLDRLDEARDAYRQAVEGKNERAKQSLARLEGVKSVFRTARIDCDEDVVTDKE
jgi:Flp pilus assembly protein TadD